MEAGLARVLGSEAFTRSERLRRFLEFVVTAALAGRMDRIKEYTLAVEVFDRGDEFDSRIDTIVRVEARRLRAQLREYYAGEGKDDPVLIEVPKGGYRPLFRFAAPPAGAPPAASTEPMLVDLDPRTIAVLPFEDMSSEQDQEFFCNGITEEITTALTHVDGLNVISRTSAFAFKGTAIDVRTVGEKLGAGRVLEGSVRRSSERLRITAQLINAETGHHLWAQRFDVASRDVLDVQDKVTAAIVERLHEGMLTAGKGGLGSGAGARAAERHSASLEAYTRYLEGRFHANRHTREDLERAIACYREAIDIDARYGLAQAALAETHIEGSLQGWMEPSEAMPVAEASAQRALEIDDRLPEAHSALAAVLFRYHFDWERAGAEYRRALELRPGHGTLRNWYSSFLLFRGHHEQAVSEAQAALELDPLSVEARRVLAGNLYFSGRFDEAIAECVRVLELDPHYFWGYFFRGLARGGQELWDQAVADLERACALSPGLPIGRGALGWAQAGHGNVEEARAIAAKLMEQRASGHRLAFIIAVVHAGLGEAKAALDWLETAFDERDSRVLLISASRMWDGLRHEPRFVALLERIGLG